MVTEIEQKSARLQKGLYAPGDRVSSKGRLQIRATTGDHPKWTPPLWVAYLSVCPCVHQFVTLWYCLKMRECRKVRFHYWVAECL